MENLKAIVETLIFVSETPLSAIRIKEILGDCEKAEIVDVIQELAKEYEDRKGGLILQEVAGGFQFRTNPDLSSWIKKLKGVKPAAISQPALETLAIIAYRQPVVKADIERIRGVDVSGPLKGLLDKKLVRMVGRKDVPGKPMLYGTTKRFLEVFNLSDLSELPTLRELKELQETYELQEKQRARALSDSEELPLVALEEPQDIQLPVEDMKEYSDPQSDLDQREFMPDQETPVEEISGMNATDSEASDTATAEPAEEESQDA